MSPPRNSQSSGTRVTIRQASETQSQEPPTKVRAPVLDPELGVKERKKEAKILKKYKSKLLSKPEVGEQATSHSEAGKPSSQLQEPLGAENNLQEKHESKDEKKERKKQETAEVDENGKTGKKRKIAETDEFGKEKRKKRNKSGKENDGQILASNVYSSTPIPTSKRSFSTIPRPNSTSKR